MSLQIEQVTIKKFAKTASGKGGKVTTWSDSATAVDCTVNYPSPRAAVRQGQGDNSPGAAQSTKAIFFFDQDPSPTVKREWKIVQADGTEWTVLNKRTYEGPQLQVEAELIA